MAKDKTSGPVEDAVVVEETATLLPVKVSTKQQAEALLKSVQDEIKTCSTRVSKLNIKDDTTLKIAKDATKELNVAIKNAKALGKDAKMPLKQRIDMIDEVVGLLIGDAEAVLKDADSKVIAYNLEQEKKRLAAAEELRKKQEEENRKAQIEAKRVADAKQSILDYESNWLEVLEKAKTKADHGTSKNAIDQMEGAFTDAIVEEFADDLAAAKKRMMQAGENAYKIMIQEQKLKEQQNQLSATELKRKQEQLAANKLKADNEAAQAQLDAKEEALAEVEQVLDAAQEKIAKLDGQATLLENQKTEGMRDAGWEWEVANDKGVTDMVIEQFKSVDPKKVKDWIRDNKEKLETSEPVPNYPYYSKKTNYVFGGLAFFKKPKTLVHV